MIIYLSGPMTSSHRDGTDYPTFETATARLRDLGHLVISPAENFGGADAGWDACMKQDIHALLTADAVVVLPDWHEARMVGVRVELVLAATLGLPIHRYHAGRGFGPEMWRGLTNRELAAHLLNNPDPR